MPQTTLKNAIAYEDWIAEVDGNFQWKEFDENTAAAMCCTSGTTGDPKGVLYSHRSNVLHALMANNSDALGTQSQGCDVAGGAAVSRQQLGHCVFGAEHGHQAGDAGTEARWRFGVRTALDREGHIYRRRADSLADAAAVHGHRKEDTAGSQGSHLRRFGNATLHDQGIHGYGCRSPPRVGHDRDEPHSAPSVR